MSDQPEKLGPLRETGKLNAFLTMVVDQAIQLAKSDEEAGRNPTDLAQRIAIGIIQGRALECRHHSGKLIIDMNQFLMRFRPAEQAAARAAAMAISIHLRERSHKLEQLGLLVAKSPWPPTGEETVEDSRMELV